MQGIKTQIALELYQVARKLGAKSDLLTIIGSYGDTLNDGNVLHALRRWNKDQAHLTPHEEDEPQR